MKKFVILISLFIYSINTNASHLFGGEITWQCITSGTDAGKYIFTLKVYRDCNGIPYTPASGITIYSTDSDSTHFPSTWNISLGGGTIITDLSPSFCPNNCSTGGPGTVQEYVQKSIPVTLSGIPPSTGWVFEMDDCCRNSLINMSGSGFTIRSIMYPFNNQNTNPCFDSSPYFAERPQLYTCTGYIHNYNPFATDAELDSLHYSFDQCLEQPTSNPPDPFYAPIIPYIAPYSINSPVPGNVVLDPHSGDMIMNPGISGNFAFTVKVESFKCGFKVAEIYRDMAFTLTNGCTLSTTSSHNTPPDITPPFADPISGLFTLYSDTVFVGDTVDFDFAAFDSEIGTSSGNNFNAQSITLNSFGSQYGTGFTNPNSGCLIPPCATLSPGLPTPYLLIGATTHFNWITTPAHLGLQYGCVYLPNTYYFLMKTEDNYCPTPALGYKTVSVTVLPTVPAPIVNNNGGNLSTPLIPGFSYQWYRNRFLIPGATSNSFSPVTNGYYQVRIMDANFNGNYSDGYNVTTGIIDPSEKYNIIVYPNPTKGIATLQLNVQPSTPVAYTIRDISGSTLFREEIKNHLAIIQKKIDLTIYTNGIYFLELSVDGILINKKLVISD